MPLEDKLAVLAAADAGLRTEPGVALTLASFQALRVHKLFASTEGALCEQVLTECGGGVSALALRGDESQVRSYPASHGGQVEQAGYERFLALDLPAAAPRVSEEAVALLSAPACPAGSDHAAARARAARRCSCTSRSATPWSSTGCSAARPPMRARASCLRTGSARCASAPST